MYCLDPQDTIAAIANPPGPGLVGLIRISGPEAVAIAGSGFETAENREPPTRPDARSGQLKLAGLRESIPVKILFWPGHRTYTGQPLAEVQTVGSPPVLRAVLAHYLAQGARLAEPGEFTLRAFLSGRIDLTQSEAVLGVIDARTPAQLDAALTQLAGGLAGPIGSLRDLLLDHLAHLEANLDFDEEPDVDPLGREILAATFDRAATEILHLSEQLRGRDLADERPRVVLVGPPNAGKSRLFNALAGEDRAIVSPRAGTTRDYLTAPCDCDGLTVELIDTAGIETPHSGIEAQAQSLRAEQFEQADLRLICSALDADPEPAGEPTLLTLLVRTKADLATPSASSAIATSAATGQGLNDLRRAIADKLRTTASDSDALASTSARCRDSLIRAGESLQSASEALRAGYGDELVAVDLRQVLDDLGRVVGAVVTDDILDRIFQRFCIGK